MEKKFLSTFLLLVLFAATALKAQPAVIYGSQSDGDSIWGIDTVSQSVVVRRAASLPGFVLEGIQGFAWDPTSHQVFCVVALTGVNNRVLCGLDLQSGVLTQIGNVGDRISAITFRGDGQLFGVTGNGANIPFTVYEIDKTNADTTYALTLGNGNGGELIAFNPDDQMIYHWSGSTNAVFEKFSAYPPYAPVLNIPITNPNQATTIGALYVGNGNFVTANSLFQYRNYSMTGTIGSLIYQHDHKMHGLIMPPTFAASHSVLCAEDTLSIKMTGIAMDSAIYDWGDGTRTVVFPAGSAAHRYTIGGTNIVKVSLSNPNYTTQMAIFGITVNNLPGIPITPGGNVAVCDTNQVVLTGPPGGNKQWYRNGLAIPGETGQTINVTLEGIYNVTKINTNGCKDSADVGANVKFGNRPIVDLGADISGCEGTACFAANVQGAQYTWSDGSTDSIFCPSQSGLVFLDVFDAAGCKGSDTANATIAPLPRPMPAADTAFCPLISFSSNDPNATAWTWDFGDGSNFSNQENPNHSYGSTGIYTVRLSNQNSCGARSDSLTLNIDCTIGFEEESLGDFSISPNPGNGSFALELLLTKASNLRYTVFDLQGRRILDKDIPTRQLHWREQLNLNVESGLYFIRIEAAGKVAFERIEVL